MKHRKKITWLVLLCVFTYMVGASFLPIHVRTVKAADELNYKWEKNNTLDELLQVVDNKAGDDEIFLKWNLVENGTYTLEYYLKDDIRTTVTFDYSEDQLDVKYALDDMSTGTPVSKTQEQVDLYYAEMNYNLLVPKMETVAKTVTGGAIEFQVTSGASSKYPGASFNINNTDVRFKWDMQSDTMYFLSKGVPKGHIVPCILKTPSLDTERIEILRSLSEFNVNPTHWIPVGGNNEDLKSLDIPTDVAAYKNERPGSKPGIRISFEQPKIFDDATYEFKTATNELQNVGAIIGLTEIGSLDYTDFTIKLNAQDDKIVNAPDAATINDNVEYKYDGGTGTYTIEIVKDKSTLNNEDTDYMQWDGLDASKIYNVQVSLDESPDYLFDEYQPENEYGYTYLQYEIKRASMDDAYLQIVPYSGSSEDELEYTIYYSKSYKSEFDEDDVWLKHYHSTDYNDTDIYIPVPFMNGSSQEYYQVGVEFAGSPLKSQVIKYIPKDDENVPPPVPKIESITNLAVVPPLLDTETEPSKVQFDLIWEAPSNNIDNPVLDNMLAKGDIYYELLANDVSSDSSGNSYNVIKVFKVSDNSGSIEVTEVNTGMPIATGYNEPSNNNYSNGYNSDENLFAMKDIVIKDSTDWSTIPTITTTTSPVNYTVTPSSVVYDYEFPGINFLRMRSVYVATDGIGFSDQSIPDSLSLSMIKLEVPIADQLEYVPRTAIDDTDPIAINVNWNAVNTENYDDQMLYPVNLNLEEVIYGVYITEEKNNINNLDIQDVKNEDTTLTNFIKLTYGSDRVQISDAERAELRNGKVAFFEIPTLPSQQGDIGVDIENLDPNTNYYIRVVTKLQVKDKSDPTNVSMRYSDPSNMLSVTSPVRPTEPGEEEKIPISPDEVVVDFVDENKLNTSVTWVYPEEIKFEEDSYGFEIFSIEDRSIPSSLDSRETKIEDIVESALLTDDHVEAWRLYVNGGTPTLIKYNKATDTWNPSGESYEIGGNKIKLIDSSNNTNKVMYYYVRTVRIQSGAVLKASSWVADTITTSPITGPINLIVSYNTHSYNPKTEAVIRFDAPIPRNSNLSTDYNMEIYVKSDDDADYTGSKYSTTFLEEVDGANDGYSRLYYKISGLKPGKSYSIKVRVVDKTKTPEVLPDGSTSYPKSNFSEKVETRTDFDQEDYDKENKYNQYIQYYLKHAETLKNTSYWVVEEDDEDFKIKYRKDYTLGQLSQLSNTQFNMVSQEKFSLTYYLPSEVVEESNTNGVTFLIKNGNTQFGIRPYTINISSTKEVTDMVKKIKAYDSNIEDYYIRVVISKGEYNGFVKGRKPVSDLINIELQVVGSSGTEAYVEQRILNELDMAINNHKLTLMNKLEQELVNGINDEKLLEIVNDTLTLVKVEHKQDVKSIMNQYIQDEYSLIDEVDEPIYFSAQLEDDIVHAQAYQKDGYYFKEVFSNYSSGKYLLDLEQPGAYIFTQKTSSVDDLDNVYNGLTSDMVSKYNLLDIYSNNEITSSTQTVYKYQVIASVARLLGAEKGQDDSKWLEKFNITVSNSGQYETITREEALYLLVRTYGEKYHINLETINIHDYGLIEDYDAVKDDYKEVLLIGANLGLIPVTDGLIRPKDSMTVKDTLELLTRVENNIDW